MNTKNKRLKIILLIITILLITPLIAIQFTDEVKWTLIDFIIAGTLLLSTGLILDFIIKKIKNIQYRIALSIALFIILLLIWVELAVGIFGTPIDGN